MRKWTAVEARCASSGLTLQAVLLTLLFAVSAQDGAPRRLDALRRRRGGHRWAARRRIVAHGCILEPVPGFPPGNPGRPIDYNVLLPRKIGDRGCRERNFL